MLDAENPAENSDVTPVAEPDDTGDATPVDTADGATTENAGESPAENAGEDSTQNAGAAPTETGGDTPGEVVPADEAAAASEAPAKKTAAKRATAKKTAAKKATAKKTASRRTGKKAAEAAAMEAAGGEAPVTETGEAVPTVTGEEPTNESGEAAVAAAEPAPAAKKAAKKVAKRAPAKRATKKAASAQESAEAPEELPFDQAGPAEAPAVPEPAEGGEEPTVESAAGDEQPVGPPPATALLFQPPDPTKAVVTRRRRATRPEAPAAAESEAGGPARVEEGEEPRRPSRDRAGKPAEKGAGTGAEAEEPTEQAAEEAARAEEEEQQGGERRRRRRGGRRRRRGGGDENGSAEDSEGSGGAEAETSEQGAEAEEDEEAAPSGSRRRRRRRRSGESAEGNGEEAEGTAARARKPRNAEDEITAVTGSTRLEAKKQRRREGREAGRRRAPIVSEAEFLARRESVDRVMVIRQRKDLTQIAVLEDKVLVEHYVARESQTSLIGNVYLGRVQNVLPSMEAAFIDIGKGRNAVLYAGEVNWDALGAKNGSPRKIEQVLKSGQTVLVQVTKDPIGHKGARLTSQVSLPGRFLVYVPDGTTSGISRKLPDTERNRLKNLLKEIVPDSAGVIVRTAAEGASEEELTRDVERLRARWEDIEQKVSSGNAPQMLYGEPDLTLKVVRDLFTEDFNKLVVSGDEAWEMVEGYVSHVAPDLADRLEKYDGQRDVFAEYRIDEQIEKALDRKVWLPSGGSLVIDRTEAMTVVDVNTGKFTGSGGNLEETVTKNNLEAAEEIVRQLRLRDIGGIIVVDFIDMVLESNRDLVLRRLVECLGRDRTRHQVAEVTSLGLVQMTRKRIGTGLLEAFSEGCDVCGGRGLILHHEPVEPKKKSDEESRRGRRGGRGRGREETAANAGQGGGVPSPKELAAMARHDEKPAEEPGAAPAAGQRSGGEEPGGGQPAAKGPEGADRETEPLASGSDTVSAGAPEDGAAPLSTEEGEEAASRRSGRSRGGRGRGARRRADATSEEQEGAEEGRPQEGAPRPTPLEPTPGEQVEVGSTETAAVPGGATLPGSEASGEDTEAPKGAGEAAAETVPAEPAVPPTPTVVTTVRRRSARRPAGPPSAAAAQPSSPIPAATGSVAVDEPADENIDEPADVDPIATLVDEAEEPARLDGGDVDGAGPDAQGTPHVPVKKRGSRRR